MTLIRRIFLEKRPILLPLGLLLLANIALYAFVVYPLGARSASAADRASAAAQSLRAAERDLAAARALVSGKSLAAEQLATFYEKVLPSTLSAARRITYEVPTLAHKAKVKYEAKIMDRELVKEPGREPGKDSHLERLKTRVVLQGDYEAIRQFVYDLETADQFIIIDDVSLAQAESDKPLTLTLDLSTYYRL
jgi:hypothetical protein